jgi:hypothetical protein
LTGPHTPRARGHALRQGGAPNPQRRKFVHPPSHEHGVQGPKKGVDKSKGARPTRADEHREQPKGDEKWPHLLKGIELRTEACHNQRTRFVTKCPASEERWGGGGAGSKPLPPSTPCRAPPTAARQGEHPICRRSSTQRRADAPGRHSAKAGRHQHKGAPAWTRSAARTVRFMPKYRSSLGSLASSPRSTIEKFWEPRRGRGRGGWGQSGRSRQGFASMACSGPVKESHPTATRADRDVGFTVTARVVQHAQVTYSGVCLKAELIARCRRQGAV